VLTVVGGEAVCEPSARSRGRIRARELATLSGASSRSCRRDFDLSSVSGREERERWRERVPRLTWAWVAENWPHHHHSREVAARLKILRHLETLTSHNILFFSIPLQRSMSLSLACPRLFISSRASVLDCRPNFTPHSLTFHTSSLAPCHVLQMATVGIVSTTCDAYSPVCLLYQLLVSLFFFFFHNKQLLGSSTVSEVYNITTSQYLGTHHLNRRYRHCELIRVILPTPRATHINPAGQLG